jgi:hypothetical protein
VRVTCITATCGAAYIPERRYNLRLASRQAFDLQWDTAPNTYCTPSGGAPNDGWASTAFSPGTIEEFNPQVTTLGTYTYTLQCSAGPVSQQQSVTVTFENNAPYVTASLSSSSVTFTDSPADYVDVSYNSNLSECTLLTTPTIPLTNSGSLNVPPDPQGLVALAPAQSGTYQISMKCDGAPNYNVTSTLMTLTVLPPPPPAATISFNPSTAVAGESFSASWSASNAASCTLTGGIPDGTWGTQNPAAASGTDHEMSQVAGQFTFGVSCPSIDPNTASASATANLTIDPGASLSATETAVTNGQSFTLVWSSVGATSCTGSGGGASGAAWSGSVGTSGTLSQTATTNGTFTYALNCSAGALAAAPQQVTVTVSAASSGSSSSGKGGGGDLGFLELAALAGLLAWRVRAPRRALCGYFARQLA